MTIAALRAERPVTILGYSLCVAGFVVALVAFYPGYLSEDSISQLLAGRNWVFDDWHPPVMAATWGLIDKLIAGPFGMLLLHNALFWGAAAVFWRATNRKSPMLGLALVLIGFMPQLLALLSTIWKDVGLGAALLLATALLYTAAQKNSKSALCFTIPLLFYGYAVRHNAAAAVFPLSMWAGFIACRIFPALKSRAVRLRALPVLIGLIYFGSLSFAVIVAQAGLAKGRKSYPVQAVWLHDLAAISAAKGEALFPEYIINDQNFSLKKVTAGYHPSIAGVLLPESGMKLSNNYEDISALRSKWWQTITDNKTIYLRHRWAAFEQVLGFKTDAVCIPYISDSSPNAFGFKARDSKLREYLNSYFYYFRNSVLFRGFFWLLISLGLVYLSLRGSLRGDLEIVFVLALSGSLYSLGYFFFAPTCDFRYVWWTVIASLVALLFFTAFVISGRRTKTNEAI